MEIVKKGCLTSSEYGKQGNIRLIKAKEFMDTLSIGKTTFYDQIKKKLIPEPVRSITGKTHWASYEVDQVVKSRMRNLSISEQQELSSRIESKRKEIDLSCW